MRALLWTAWLLACTREPSFLRAKETGAAPNPDLSGEPDTQDSPAGESGRAESGRPDSASPADTGRTTAAETAGSDTGTAATPRETGASSTPSETGGALHTGGAPHTGGSTTPTTPPDTGRPEDGDGDGAFARDDCDDADPTAFPGAPERCDDGVDQDCDGDDAVCVRLALTPTTGRLNLGEGIYWADRGYTFRAERDFEMAGASWWVAVPVGGQIRVSVYAWPDGALLARGVPAPGAGGEAWLRSDLEFSFEAGREYLVAFYTDRAESGTFRYLGFPTWGYTVDGTVSRLVGWSSTGLGDDAPEASSGAGGTFGNAWAPFQELHLR